MKKNVNLFFAIVMMIAFFSCRQEEKNSIPVWAGRNTDEVNVDVKKGVDSIKKRREEKVLNNFTPLGIRSNSNGKTFAFPIHNNVTSKPRWYTSGISIDSAMINEIIRNKKTQKTYQVSCDSVCLSDHEWLITDTAVENAIPQEATTLVPRKPFSFHKIMIEPDDSIMVEQIYAGSRFYSSSSFKDSKTELGMDHRLAVDLSFKLNDIPLSGDMAFYVQVDQDKNFSGCMKIEYDLKPTKWFTVSTGYIPTLPTVIKPDFTSPEGQNQRFTEALIPGNMIGLKTNVHFDFSKSNAGSLDVKFGGFIENNFHHFEIQAGVYGGNKDYNCESYMWLYHMGNSNTLPGFGWALKSNLPWFSSLFVLESGFNDGFDKEDGYVAHLLKIPFRWTNIPFLKRIEVFSDVVYNTDTYKWEHIENGLSYKIFSSKYLSNSIELGCDIAEKQLRLKSIFYIK